MDLVEVRELRYFMVVAEELHFSRAAQRLGMAQPPLSRAIRQLERRLGVTLFDRTSRAVRLTPAGAVLLAEGRAALAALASAVHRTQRAGRPDPRLVLAMKPGGDGGLLPDILGAYRNRSPEVTVDVHLCGVGDQAELLRAGVADAAFMHSPQRDFEGLDTVELLAERQVVVLPRQHRLAERDAVRMADLRGETMPVWPGARESGAAGAAAGGANPGPRVRDAGHLTQLITWGRTVAVLPESVRDHLPRGLSCVTVPDAPSTTLILAWPAGTRSPALAAFVRTAIAVAQRDAGAAAGRGN